MVLFGCHLLTWQCLMFLLIISFPELPQNSEAQLCEHTWLILDSILPMASSSDDSPSGSMCHLLPTCQSLAQLLFLLLILYTGPPIVAVTASASQVPEIEVHITTPSFPQLLWGFVRNHTPGWCYRSYPALGWLIPVSSRPAWSCLKKILIIITSSSMSSSTLLVMEECMVTV